MQKNGEPIDIAALMEQSIAASLANLAKIDLYAECKASPTAFSNWFGAVQKLGIPHPETVVVDCPKQICERLVDSQWLGKSGYAFLQAVKKAVEQVAERTGYPVFIKNSFTSNKHDWKDSCSLDSADLREIYRKIQNMSFYLCMGSPHPYAPQIVVREMISTDAIFAAFNEMPITQEFRFFARDGITERYQPYWPVEAFIGHEPNVDGWKEKLAAFKQIEPEVLNLLAKQAANVSAELGGFWSVDFLKDKNGKWWLIDMAEGEKSYVNKQDIQKYTA